MQQTGYSLQMFDCFDNLSLEPTLSLALLICHHLEMTSFSAVHNFDFDSSPLVDLVLSILWCSADLSMFGFRILLSKHLGQLFLHFSWI